METNYEKSHKPSKIRIEYYTDPLCCWSWSFEPQWRRLRYEYEDHINWQYIMGGMITDWRSQANKDNNRPALMRPLWKEARYVSGMPINDKVWLEHPPRSSFPSCLAVKAAELQGSKTADRYLRKIREAVMLKTQDVSSKDVLLQIALELSQQEPELMHFDRFEEDLDDKKSLSLLKADLRKVKAAGITRYPTLVVRKKGKKSLMLTGYRSYDSLVAKLREFQPDFEVDHKIELQDYKSKWGDLTEREVKEVAEVHYSED